MSINPGQNEQISILATFALRGGDYKWNQTPISDSDTEDPNFYISQPMEPLRRELLASARRRDNAIIVEPYDNPKVRTKEYAGIAPRNPYTAPASVVPATEGPERVEKGLSVGPRTFPEEFGSGEDGEEILAALDRMIRKRKRNHDDRTGTERENHVSNDERAPHGTATERRDRFVKRVAGDRQVGFDLALPLSNEVLANWNAYLRKKIDARGPAMPYFRALDGFLERVRAGHRYHELHADDRRVLKEIVRQIIETA